jgi:hypothetical protein
MAPRAGIELCPNHEATVPSLIRGAGRRALSTATLCLGAAAPGGGPAALDRLVLCVASAAVRFGNV